MPQPMRRGEMFERLMLLRACYAMRSSYDRRSDLTIRSAIDYAEWRMWLAGMRQDWRPRPSTNP